MQASKHNSPSGDRIGSITMKTYERASKNTAQHGTSTSTRSSATHLQATVTSLLPLSRPLAELVRSCSFCSSYSAQKVHKAPSSIQFLPTLHRMLWHRNTSMVGRGYHNFSLKCGYAVFLLFSALSIL